MNSSISSCYRNAVSQQVVFFSTVVGRREPIADFRQKTGYTLEHRANTGTNNYLCSHSQLCEFKVASCPNLHIYRLWEGNHTGTWRTCKRHSVRHTECHTVRDNLVQLLPMIRICHPTILTIQLMMCLHTRCNMGNSQADTQNKSKHGKRRSFIQPKTRRNN